MRGNYDLDRKREIEGEGGNERKEMGEREREQSELDKLEWWDLIPGKNRRNVFRICKSSLSHSLSLFHY